VTCGIMIGQKPETDYEKLRELNIARNRELLNGLSLSKPKGPKLASKGPYTRKLQKTTGGNPTRASSRLSSRPCPSYIETSTEETVEEKRPRQKRAERKTAPQTEVALSKFVEIRWEPTADPPTRDADQTLHFVDCPEVLIFN
jgi:hypothetical protein